MSSVKPPSELVGLDVEGEAVREDRHRDGTGLLPLRPEHEVGPARHWHAFRRREFHLGFEQPRLAAFGLEIEAPLARAEQFVPGSCVLFLVGLQGGQEPALQFALDQNVWHLYL